MYKILEKRQLNNDVTLLKVHAPMVAKKAAAGQFIIFRTDEYGERVPLTIADYDREEGSITIIFQKVGRSTKTLAALNVGENILDFVGPLGKPSDTENAGVTCVTGGGVGCAIAYPTAKALYLNGNTTHVIAGFRNKDMVILENELRAVSHKMVLTTDDGTYGEKGFVTDKLKTLIEAGNNYSTVIAIGPIPMMRAVAEVTRPYGIKTLVSLNPIMIDGTGMCGCCRVTVGNETKFACVDGPEFDGHAVDFTELINRNKTYAEQEKRYDSLARCTNCRILGGAVND